VYHYLRATEIMTCRGKLLEHVFYHKITAEGEKDEQILIFILDNTAL